VDDISYQAFTGGISGVHIMLHLTTAYVFILIVLTLMYVELRYNLKCLLTLQC